ncbi:hypothetical protein B1790_20005 [Mycobacterium sp. AT1]|uniref:Probable membrane transporter protein n=1 Tax=Mycolicibacterium iranicum TaxID=912594 RepID=A0A178LJQ3_MYCIR|nr:TSUP family transporter [Mycolicibacterium iranicum]OAN31060.1 hypothetical protein A4X20_29365 [Mycolicibacterium iranicum]OPX08277.1 hypothetical protein B1790_20005 [Mycobacterium sp. AT1]
MTIALALVVGAVIGALLELLGGGGSIMAVPALVYALGLGTAQAILTSLIVVGVASGSVPFRRCGRVRCSGDWPGSSRYSASQPPSSGLPSAITCPRRRS